MWCDKIQEVLLIIITDAVFTGYGTMWQLSSGVDTVLLDSLWLDVCWGSVNMTVISNKILNPTANLFVGVCLCGVNWPLDLPWVSRGLSAIVSTLAQGRQVVSFNVPPGNKDAMMPNSLTKEESRRVYKCLSGSTKHWFKVRDIESLKYVREFYTLLLWRHLHTSKHLVGSIPREHTYWQHKCIAWM